MQIVKNQWEEIARARVRLNRGPRIERDTLAAIVSIAITLLALAFLGG